MTGSAVAHSAGPLYASVDGGGTKIQMILFDGTGRCLRKARGGPINPNFVPLEDIQEHMWDVAAQCLRDYRGARLAVVYLAMCGPAHILVDLMKKLVCVDEVRVFSEGEMALYAGIGQALGFAVLSGTGSGVFAVDGDNHYHIGGMGGLLDDEGGGFWIGRAACVAAIHSMDQRGPKSMLEARIPAAFGVSNMWEIIPIVHQDVAYRSRIAPLVPVVIQAADDGDVEAAAILRQAGELLAHQLITLVRRERLDPQLPLMVAGSVWKNNPLMFEAFSRAVAASGLSFGQVRVPLFDPVCGGWFAHFSERGPIPEMALRQLVAECPELLYQKHGGVNP